MIKNNRIKYFLLLTFSLMYLSSISTIISLNYFNVSFDHPLNMLLKFLGGGGPTFAAFYVVYNYYSEKEKNSFFKRLFLFKVKIKWWIFAFVIPVISVVFLNLISYQTLGDVNLDPVLWIRFPMIFGASILMGGLEEIGWRGVLLDEMKNKYSLIFISIFTGILWGIWHLPLFFIEPLAFSDYNFLPYVLSTIAFSNFMTYLVIKSRSIAMAVIFHATINAFTNYDLTLPVEHSFLTYTALIVLIIIGIYILLPYNKKNIDLHNNKIKISG